jgi:hypothetical protein
VELATICARTHPLLSTVHFTRLLMRQVRDPSMFNKPPPTTLQASIRILPKVQSLVGRTEALKMLKSPLPKSMIVLTCKQSCPRYIPFHSAYPLASASSRTIRLRFPWLRDRHPPTRYSTGVLSFSGPSWSLELANTTRMRPFLVNCPKKFSIWPSTVSRRASRPFRSFKR